MMAKAEILDWVNSLPDYEQIGIDSGGLRLRCVGDDKPYLEIGGLPEGDDR